MTRTSSSKREQMRMCCCIVECNSSKPCRSPACFSVLLLCLLPFLSGFPRFHPHPLRSWNILCKSVSAERQVGAFLHKLFKYPRLHQSGVGLLVRRWINYAALSRAADFFVYCRDELTLDCICTAAVDSRALTDIT